MPFSAAMLHCLETNSLLRLELFSMKNSVTNTPDERKRYSEYYSLREQLRDSNEFFEHMRITRRVFEYVFQKTEDDLHGQVVTTKTIAAREKLFMTIRYLVTGMSLNELAQVFCIGRSTAFKIIGSTLKIIWKRLSNLHLKAPTPSEMQQLAYDFHRKWKFPSCVAAAGAKYIMITKKRRYMSLKKKVQLSVVLSAVADADSRFICIDVSELADNQECPFTDIFGKCGFKTLPGTDIKVPLVIVANNGYPLKRHIMRPFPGRNLGQGKELFNDMVKKASVPVDKAFEVLTQKFKLLSRAMCVNEHHAKLAIKVCCLLYNVAKDIDKDNDIDFLKAKEYGPDFTHSHMMKNKHRRLRAPAAAMTLRVTFQDYFMNLLQPTLTGIDNIPTYTYEK